MTRTRSIVAALTLAGALAVAVAAPGHAGTAGDGPTAATSSGSYLTIPEAKLAIRQRIRRQVREDGGTVYYREVGPCWRFSGRRVRCDYYYEASDYDGDYWCGGVMQVTETARYYGTRAVDVDCGGM
jgi:hypothetical protein